MLRRREKARSVVFGEEWKWQQAAVVVWCGLVVFNKSIRLMIPFTLNNKILWEREREREQLYNSALFFFSVSRTNYQLSVESDVSFGMEVVQPTGPELTDMTKTQTMVSSLEKRLAGCCCRENLLLDSHTDWCNKRCHNQSVGFVVLVAFGGWW